MQSVLICYKQADRPFILLPILVCLIEAKVLDLKGCVTIRLSYCQVLRKGMAFSRGRGGGPYLYKNHENGSVSAEDQQCICRAADQEHPKDLPSRRRQRLKWSCYRYHAQKTGKDDETPGDYLQPCGLVVEGLQQPEWSY